MILLLGLFASLHCRNLEDFSQPGYDRLFLLCYEFMPAQLALLSHGEESSGVIWAFSSVVSFEINCNHVLWRKGKGEVKDEKDNW